VNRPCTEQCPRQSSIFAVRSCPAVSPAARLVRVVECAVGSVEASICSTVLRRMLVGRNNPLTALERPLQRSLRIGDVHTTPRAG
jgi:hypothetical protein